MTSADNHELDEPADPLFDAMLEEVCSGQSPPDLREVILDRWKRNEMPSDAGSVAWPELPAVVVQTTRPTSSSQGGRRRHRRVLTGWIVGVTCLLTMVTAWWSYHRAGRTAHQPTVAQRDRTGSGRRPSTSGLPPLPVRDDLHSPFDTPHSEPSPSPTPSVAASSTDDATSNDIVVVTSGNPLEGATEQPADGLPVRLDNAAIVVRIDELLRERWQQQQVEPASNVSQEAWCRHVFQQLIGREPNSTELREFLQSNDPDRRLALVDHLLGSAHADELALHWSRRWTGWLLEHTPSSSRAFRTGLQNFLASALVERQRYDRIWLELLTASGSNDPQRADFAGGTNYLLALTDGADSARVVGEVCRVMLGQRAGCAQCHDDTLRNRSQQDFWQLAANFQQLKTDVLRPGRARLLDVELAADNGLTFTRSDGHPTSALPGGLDGKLFSTTGELSARSQLAQQMIDSPDFARQVVNRSWESILQYGFTLPVDDLGSHNLASHPELVQFLSDQFVAHDYDFRDLLRWIALNEAMDHSSAITIGNIKDAPTEGGIPLFSRAYHRPALFAQTSQGLAQLIAGQVPPLTYASTDAERESILGRQLSMPATGGESSASPAARAQGQLLPTHYFSLIRRFSERRLPAAQQIEHAYLVVLGRPPSAEELQQALPLFDEAAADTTVATERLFWVLLNTARP